MPHSPDTVHFDPPPIAAVDRDDAFADAVRAALDAKTKPPGSLGRLEALALQLACIQRTPRPRARPVHAFVFAGDHGVVARGVSPYPQAVTVQMVRNFLDGGAAICVLARAAGATLSVVDAGVVAPLMPRDGLIDRRVAAGTRDFTREPAMDAAECAAALDAGVALARGAGEAALLVFGEMGIGNTTSAAALMHALTGIEAADCVGRGTGADDAMLVRKRDVVATGVARHALHAVDDAAARALAALRSVGGFEIAMMAGAMLGAAASRRAFVVDGFIATAAFAVARALSVYVGDYAVFGHRSAEAAHARWLDTLDAQPLLALEMRLGEGTGAMLAVPVLQAACALLTEMATFDGAGVSGRADA